MALLALLPPPPGEWTWDRLGGRCSSDGIDERRCSGGRGDDIVVVALGAAEHLQTN